MYSQSTYSMYNPLLALPSRYQQEKNYKKYKKLNPPVRLPPMSKKNAISRFSLKLRFSFHIFF